MQQVRGVVAKKRGAPVSLETINVPDPGTSEVVVTIQACGVCHTDLHYREGGINDEFPFCSDKKPQALWSRSARASSRLLPVTSWS